MYAANRYKTMTNGAVNISGFRPKKDDGVPLNYLPSTYNNKLPSFRSQRTNYLIKHAFVCVGAPNTPQTC